VQSEKYHPENVSLAALCLDYPLNTLAREVAPQAWRIHFNPVLCLESK